MRFYGTDLGSWTGRIGLAVFSAVAIVVAGLGLLIFAGGAYNEAGRDFRNRALTSGLIGVLFLILFPIVAAIFAATVVGIPLALAVLMLVPLIFVLGYATAALGLANVLLNWTGTLVPWGWSLMFLIVGAILIALVSLIPYAGWIIILIALVIGIGAFLRTVGRRVRRWLPPAPAA